MTTRAAVPFLVGMMMLTGVANTLLTKYQDKQCVHHCDDPDPSKRKYFEQPVLQTAQMFVGEMGCWLVVAGSAVYQRWRDGSPRRDGYGAAPTADADVGRSNEDDGPGPNETTPVLSSRSKRTPVGLTGLAGLRVFLLALPAICDILGTTLMNVGLLLVAASVYQMTRGALVLFVGLFSVLFLHRRLHLFQWISLVGVVLGVAVVGLAGTVGPSAATPEKATGVDPGRAVVGVLLIAGAQIFTATQFVLEEWILRRSSMEAIRVVGWEGTFGLLFTLLGMLVLHLAVGRTAEGRGRSFDAVEGWRQMTSKPEIMISSILIMISIGGFNFFGLSVTRTVSATARSTIDTCRTLFIWMVSLGLRWESFQWLQVVGFALLVYFTFLFNGVVQPPLACLVPEDEEVEPVAPEEPIEYR